MYKLALLGFVALAYLISFFKFDRLVRVEYQRHRSDWIADGMPHGIFWVPAETVKLGGLLIRGASSLASYRCWIMWLFSTPRWARSNKNTKRAFLQWRLIVMIANLAFLILVVLVLLR